MSLQPTHALFRALGQTLLVLDSGFRIVASAGWLPDGWRQRAASHLPASEILRAGLFGVGDTFRELLEKGSREHGWRALVHFDDEPTLMTVSAAPLPGDLDPLGLGPEAAYAVVLYPVSGGARDQASPPRIFGGMIGRSAAMNEIFRLIQNLSESAVTVLVTGESGTGKELVARALHQSSTRRDHPFVAVNCAALPDQLLESELFGHVRGAFTGALHDRIGRFEAAGDGTLFLDEIGDLPIHLQAKLLRVLQERTFERLGETRGRPCRARFVAATHVDLRRAIREGRFREDLFFRLAVVTCHLPPLRDRVEDIEPLTSAMLARLDPARRLSAECLHVFLRYEWPGNVRELENALEHALAVGTGPTVELEHLPGHLRASVPSATSRARDELAPPSDAGLSDEARRLLATLESHRWRRGDAAAALGMSRTTLWRKLRELGRAD